MGISGVEDIKRGLAWPEVLACSVWRRHPAGFWRHRTLVVCPCDGLASAGGGAVSQSCCMLSTHSLGVFEMVLGNIVETLHDRSQN